MNARPITWPTVPKGKDRVRVCLHARNTKEDIERLAESVVRWASDVLAARQNGVDGKQIKIKMIGSQDVENGMVPSKL
jgi:8-amino-7-oxononanoate synthase